MEKGKKKNAKHPIDNISRQKNSEPYGNPMLWARKNLTILLHNNIQVKKKKKKIAKHPIDNISRKKKIRTLPQSNTLGKEKSHNTTTQ